MKLMHIDRRVAFCMVLGIVGLALGCSEGYYQGSSSSAGSGGDGSGGADAGRICTWSGTGGGITIPDCLEQRDAIVFLGTLDGKPYNEMFGSVLATLRAAPWNKPPYSVVAQLPATGRLYVEWGDPNDAVGQFVTLTSGELKLPTDLISRKIQPGSLLRMQCGGFPVQFILNLDGGQLTACAK
jgi:hypothetical protein